MGRDESEIAKLGLLLTLSLLRTFVLPAARTVVMSYTVHFDKDQLY